ncbi:MAG: PAS domain-containing protein [Anaerolineae bacterium]|nr:PAS domain-containing protein [Anaerolineae bacterium]
MIKNKAQLCTALMLRLKKQLSPPVFADEQKSYNAAILHITLITVLAASFLIVIVLTLTTKDVQSIGAIVMVGIVALIGVWLIRRGYVGLFSFALPLIVLGGTSYIQCTGQGIHDISQLGYPAVLILASLLLRTKGLFIFTLLGIGALVGIASAEIQGILVTPYTALTGFDDVIIQAIILGLTAMLLQVTVNNLSDSLARARRHEQALAASNRQLQEEISERKRTEQALRASEEKYRLFMQNFQGIAYQASHLTFKPTFFYGAVEQISGYPAADFVRGDITWDQLIYPDDLPRIRQEGDKIRTTPGYVADNEYRIRRKDGTLRWVNDIGLTVCDDSGISPFVQGAIYDITERKQAEEQLQTSLREKEALLREIHHRVKNNLQVVCALLDLQAGAITDAQAKIAFQESHNRVRSMAQIHEQLTHAANLAQVDMAAYVQELVNSLQMVYDMDTISIKIDVSGVTLPFDLVSPCGLLINELVSNAMKHAFPFPLAEAAGAYEIRIELKPAGVQKIALLVSDNGVGLPAQIDLENPGSLGLTLVKLLTRQLNATLEVKRNGGTTVKVMFTP